MSLAPSHGTMAGMLCAGRWLALVAAVAITGCATSNTTTVHETLSEPQARPLPRKLLLLPAEVRVHEVSAGGVVEKVDDWTQSASAHAMAYLREVGAARGYELIESPRLSAEDRAVLDEHIALYSLVAGSAYFAQHAGIAAWRERGKQFDYSLGPGLKDLAAHTGADAAVVVVGTDYISSSGRKMAMLFGVLLAGMLSWLKSATENFANHVRAPSGKRETTPDISHPTRQKTSSLHPSMRSAVDCAAHRPLQHVRKIPSAGLSACGSA